jgi:putative N6-adenine-specific DNA methylase
VRANGAVGAGAGRFGFERWASFDTTEQAAWRALRERAEARKKPMGATIVARDVSGEALAATKANAARAGVSIAIERASVTTLKDSDFLGARPIYVVTNPPYGERIELPPEIERAMGRALAGLSSATVGVLAGGPALLEAIPRRPSSLLPVMNGDLECRFAIYEPGREA